MDEYLDRVDAGRRAALERIRALVKRLVREVEETMGYGMPTPEYRGRAFVCFTAAKKHMSFVPASWAIEEPRDRLDGYTTTEHSIRFALEHPLPDDPIEDLVRIHGRRIEAGRSRSFVGRCPWRRPDDGCAATVRRCGDRAAMRWAGAACAVCAVCAVLGPE